MWFVRRKTSCRLAASTMAVGFEQKVLAEVRAYTQQEGVTVEQFVQRAVVERLNRMSPAASFQRRAARGDKALFLSILERSGSEPPRDDDTL